MVESCVIEGAIVLNDVGNLISTMSTRGGHSSSKKQSSHEQTLERTDNSLDDNDVQHVHDDLETVHDPLDDVHNV